ncbi:similar to Saccharomyces cerevisiae YLR040C Putative protein of unknown function [Maudiozyma saulgeensis]|uniref:Uncharacterized protein n=1 Tax=Maudiozyma saulgeensis TaxID=1789683 RepID=A0A1X7QZP2_9SACH|nr:similar to Saccharomyces cerevisiae YLR040C Putative protein of unknown function [Kazachstania saulgeensis]
MLSTVLLFTLFTLINSVTASTISDDQYLYRSMAEEKDFKFFIAFLNDFDTNYPSYTSYMIENKLKLPQQVADYYNHLAKLPSTIDLELDIINSFPYTEFQTFVTNFPWYSSLLKQGDITTMYLPRDFISVSNEESSMLDSVTTTTTNTTTNSISAQSSRNNTNSSTLFSSSSSTETTKTSKTSNNGIPPSNTMSLSAPLYMLVIVMGILL